MKPFTVQCGSVAYFSATVTVEAETLAEALHKAVAAANQSPAWSSADYSGKTYVEAVAEGDDVDLWNDERVRPLPVSSRFTEDGEGPHIIITVEGGIIQHVDFEGGIALVEVHDYDTEGTSEPGEVIRDSDGTPYLRGIWTNRIADADPDNASGTDTSTPAPDTAG